MKEHIAALRAQGPLLQAKVVEIRQEALEFWDRYMAQLVRDWYEKQRPGAQQEHRNKSRQHET